VPSVVHLSLVARLVFVSLAGAYLAIFALLYFTQDRLLFFPVHVPASEIEARAQKGKFVPWMNLRGEQIGWRSLKGDPANAVIVCHGNGGSQLETQYKAISRDGAFQIYQLEYPGFGTRAGKPSTEAFVNSTVDAIDTLHATDPKSRLWLVGESMGTGVVCAAAAARPNLISGLVLVTPFDSLSTVAAWHFPWLPVSLLLRHHLDSVRNLAGYHGPVAVILAEKDRTIPPWLGRHLYDTYAGPKQLWMVPGVGHGDRDNLFADWSEYSHWLLSHARRPAE